jgi:hypothetical protein
MPACLHACMPACLHARMTALAKGVVFYLENGIEPGRESNPQSD